MSLIVCFSFVTLEARAYEFNDIPQTTQNYVFYQAAETSAPTTAADYVHSVRGHPFANEVLRLVNIERFHEGVPPVEVHPVLTQAARIRAQETLRLDNTHFWEHARPDGRQWYTVFPEVNLSMASVGRTGENVARGASVTPEEVVRTWMESPRYRYNLLSPEWIATGVWAATNDWGRIDLIQLFCTEDFLSYTATELDAPPADVPPALNEPEYIPQPTPDYIYIPAAQPDAQPAQAVDTQPIRVDPFANEILRLVNIERFHEGVPPVEMHPALTQAALRRAQETLRLDNTQFASHLRPDGRQWYTVFPEVNLSMASLRRTGENVARGGSVTPEEMVRAWMNSPRHRYNLLSPEWAATGVWVARNEWGRMDVVQLFTPTI